jgi:uncharacterized protein YcaQ
VEITALLVMETNRYYHGHFDRLDDRPSPLPDVIKAEMLAFLSIMIQMGHCIWDKLTDYWSMTTNSTHTFLSSAMKQDRYLHILRFLHFTENKNEPDMTDRNSDMLWKMQNLSEIQRKTFSKFYNPSEHLAINEVIMWFKGRVIF